MADEGKGMGIDEYHGYTLRPRVVIENEVPIVISGGVQVHPKSLFPASIDVIFEGETTRFNPGSKLHGKIVNRTQRTIGEFEKEAFDEQAHRSFQVETRYQSVERVIYAFLEEVTEREDLRDEAEINRSLG